MSGWLKGIGILCIASAVLYVGIVIARTYKRRIDFWEQMVDLCSFLENEIRYTANRPTDIFLRFDWRESVWQTGVTFFSFEEKIGQIDMRLRFDESEKRWLSAFYRGLGTTDLEGQLAHLSSHTHLFEGRVRWAQEQYASKGKLVRSLSVLGAMMTVVLLI